MRITLSFELKGWLIFLLSCYHRPFISKVDFVLLDMDCCYSGSIIIFMKTGVHLPLLCAVVDPVPRCMVQRCNACAPEDSGDRFPRHSDLHGRLHHLVGHNRDVVLECELMASQAISSGCPGSSSRNYGNAGPPRRKLS